jgi:flagellar basal-body rod protein FlgC
MDFFSSMRVSASALDAQQTRMNTTASNIANVDTAGYKRKDPVFEANTDRESFGEILQNKMDENVQGVLVTEVAEDTRPPRLVYNPGHPKARADGYVEMPNINVAEEMANTVSASRSYEANITALNAAKNMAMKALDIGK